MIYNGCLCGIVSVWSTVWSTVSVCIVFLLPLNISYEEFSQNCVQNKQLVQSPAVDWLWFSNLILVYIFLVAITCIYLCNRRY